ncbi:hypothetical protein GCM10007103_00820 [Salinimicrobium marinum]|uniref:DUF1206 domain-containing protein n=1 Tax=Salinimicrobium marinum TaxID=680283 RepID=A0A918S6W2_9FLAO|nr:DUF1206 domain-containing protein [Salinimicrobium marinum]GHA23606.1 hypothetical protein GCM10007103_00820 [Salinimicrobium marinum]
MESPREHKNPIRYLPFYGCISTGLIYIAVGVVAILSMLRIKQGGADESSLLKYLNDYTWGKVVVWMILFGMLSYIVWRVYESIKDPYNYGSDLKGKARRAGIGLSSIADALIAFSAVVVLIGASDIQEDGRPEQQREMVGNMLQESWGSWVIILLGVIVSGTALVQFFYGITRGYRERMDIAHFNKEKRKLIYFFAYTGYLSRGIIIGIIGYFFIRAGLSKNQEYVVNTDKAFNFIGDHVGLLPFVLVAVGTICYGLFMFALGITYDVDNDPSGTHRSPETEKP